MAINLSSFPDREQLESQIAYTLEDLKGCESRNGQKVRYPGEGMMQIREESLKNGVWVDEEIWKGLLES